MIRGARIAAIGAAFAVVALIVALLGGCANQQEELVRAVGLGPLGVVPLGAVIW